MEPIRERKEWHGASAHHHPARHHDPMKGPSGRFGTHSLFLARRVNTRCRPSWCEGRATTHKSYTAIMLAKTSKIYSETAASSPASSKSRTKSGIEAAMGPHPFESISPLGVSVGAGETTQQHKKPSSASPMTTTSPSISITSTITTVSSSQKTVTTHHRDQQQQHHHQQPQKHQQQQQQQQHASNSIHVNTSSSTSTNMTSRHLHSASSPARSALKSSAGSSGVAHGHNQEILSDHRESSKNAILYVTVVVSVYLICVFILVLRHLRARHTTIPSLPYYMRKCNHRGHHHRRHHSHYLNGAGAGGVGGSALNYPQTAAGSVNDGTGMGATSSGGDTKRRKKSRLLSAPTINLPTGYSSSFRNNASTNSNIKTSTNNQDQQQQRVANDHRLTSADVTITEFSIATKGLLPSTGPSICPSTHQLDGSRWAKWKEPSHYSRQHGLSALSQSGPVPGLFCFGLLNWFGGLGPGRGTDNSYSDWPSTNMSLSRLTTYNQTANTSSNAGQDKALPTDHLCDGGILTTVDITNHSQHRGCATTITSNTTITDNNNNNTTTTTTTTNSNTNNTNNNNNNNTTNNNNTNSTKGTSTNHRDIDDGKTSGLDRQMALHEVCAGQSARANVAQSSVGKLNHDISDREANGLMGETSAVAKYNNTSNNHDFLIDTNDNRNNSQIISDRHDDLIGKIFNIGPNINDNATTTATTTAKSTATTTTTTTTTATLDQNVGIGTSRCSTSGRHSGVKSSTNYRQFGAHSPLPALSSQNKPLIPISTSRRGQQSNQLQQQQQQQQEATFTRGNLYTRLDFDDRRRSVGFKDLPPNDNSLASSVYNQDERNTRDHHHHHRHQHQHQHQARRTRAGSEGSSVVGANNALESNNNNNDNTATNHNQGIGSPGNGQNMGSSSAGSLAVSLAHYRTLHRLSVTTDSLSSAPSFSTASISSNCCTTTTQMTATDEQNISNRSSDSARCQSRCQEPEKQLPQPNQNSPLDGGGPMGGYQIRPGTSKKTIDSSSSGSCSSVSSLSANETGQYCCSSSSSHSDSCSDSSSSSASCISLSATTNSNNTTSNQNDDTVHLNERGPSWETEL